MASSLLLPQVNASVETNDQDMAQRLTAAALAEDYETLISILGSDNYAKHLNSFIDGKTDDVNTRFWLQCLHMISILLKFVRAQREGLWDSHIDAFRAMLPYFHR